MRSGTPKHLSLVMALTCPLLVAHDASSCGGQLRVFGVYASDLDDLRGLPRAARSARLHEMGVTRDDWLPDFRKAVQRYVAMCDGLEERDSSVLMRAIYGAMLVELLGEPDAADDLRRMAGVRDPVGGSLTYSALLALDALGTEQAFLLSMLDHPHPETVQVAILTLGVHDDAAIARTIERVGQTRQSDPQVGEAISFIKFYQDNLAQYSKLSVLDEKIRFVEQRLSSAYVALFDGTSWWDPYTGGDPLARWAMARWADFSREAASRVAAAIQRVRYHENAEIAAGYRQFLTNLADPEVKKHLPADGK